MHSAPGTAIEHLNPAKASAILVSRRSDGQINPLALPEALFPVVQRVLHPPFINPHLSRIYAITWELVPFLELMDIATLLRFEVEDYRRTGEKLSPLARPDLRLRRRACAGN